MSTLWLVAAVAWAVPVDFFETQVPVSGDVRVDDVHVVDLEGDGTDEVLTIFAEEIRVWRHTPAGLVSEVLPITGDWFRAFDADGDGLLDLLVRDGSFVTVYAQGAAWASIGAVSTTTAGMGADVDGDGDQDYVTPGPTWWENKNAGATWLETPVGSATSGPVAAADLDGDGDLDLVAEDGDLYVYYGDGTGFSWDRQLLDADPAGHVEILDADNDGALDIVYGNGGTLDVALGGAPTASGFDPPLRIVDTTGGGSEWSVGAVGGALELLVVNKDALLRYRITDLAIPAVEETLETVLPSTHARVRWGDLDGDGVAEALFAGDVTRMSVYSGFPSIQREIAAATAATAWIDDADLDGDGDGDVVVTVDGDAYWYENDGRGFDWTGHIIATALDADHAYHHDVAELCDVDSDLDPDLIYYSHADELVFVLKNGGGPAPTWTRVEVGPEVGVVDTACGDLDGDGLPEIMVATEEIPRVLATWSTGDGATWARSVFAGPEAYPYTGVGMGDLDVDGDLEVLTEHDGDRFYAYDNRAGDGSLWTQLTIATGPPSGARRYEIGDMDADGDNDIISIDPPADFQLLENVDGYASVWAWATGTGIEASSSGVELADVDLDGDLDVLTVGGGQWFENDLAAGLAALDGNNTFIPATGTVFAVFDVDGDGDADLVTEDGSGSLVVVRNGLLAPVDDLDHDGVPELEDGCPADFDPFEPDADADGASVACDCDDLDAARHPAAVEVCDGIDEDCDGVADQTFDLDGDGESTCGPDGAVGTGDDDCDDADPDVYPGASERCDGLDEDCDGFGELDEDLDGHLACDDCDDADPTVGAPSAEVPYDGLDNDCDATTPDDDLDGDGFPLSDDCDDDDDDAFPGATDTCGDDLDQDCDGSDLACADPCEAQPCATPDSGSGGCGCAASADPWAGWPWIVALSLVRRRGKRQRGVGRAPGTPA